MSENDNLYKNTSLLYILTGHFANSLPQQSDPQQPLGDGLLRLLGPALRGLPKDGRGGHWQLQRHLCRPLPGRGQYVRQAGQQRDQRPLPQRPHAHEPDWRRPERPGLCRGHCYGHERHHQPPVLCRQRLPDPVPHVKREKSSRGKDERKSSLVARIWQIGKRLRF